MHIIQRIMNEVREEIDNEKISVWNLSYIHRKRTYYYTKLNFPHINKSKSLVFRFDYSKFNKNWYHYGSLSKIGKPDEQYDFLIDFDCYCIEGRVLLDSHMIFHFRQKVKKKMNICFDKKLYLEVDHEFKMYCLHIIRCLYCTKIADIPIEMVMMILNFISLGDVYKAINNKNDFII